MRISVFSEKGGVGKTSITLNLSSIMAKRGFKTLLIDMDPQGHIGKILGIKENKRILNLLLSGKNIKDYIRTTRIDKLFVILSDWSLADFTVNVARDRLRHIKLRALLDGIREDFDYIFIDSPPSLELITLNVILASDFVLIPAVPTYLGLYGVRSTVGVIQNIKKVFNYSPRYLVVPNMFEGREDEMEILDILRKNVKTSSSIIRRDRNVDIAQSYGLTVWEYSPQSPAVKDFENLADEIILLS